jgi:hypothetical protein
VFTTDPIVPLTAIVEVQQLLSCPDRKCARTEASDQEEDGQGIQPNKYAAQYCRDQEERGSSDLQDEREPQLTSHRETVVEVEN